MARKTIGAALRVVAPDEKAPKRRKAADATLPPSRPDEPNWSFWMSPDEAQAIPANDVRDALSTASNEWQRIVYALDAQGLLSAVDLVVLTDHCLVVARLLLCERDIARRGLWTPGERGDVKNPATTIANSLRSQLRYTTAALLLTPAARLRTKGTSGGDKVKEDNPFD